MNSTLRRTVSPTAAAVLGVMLAVSTVLIVGVVAAPTARPATAPPWEPDPNSVGGLTFYNPSGQVITGGSVNDSPIAAYVEGTKAIRAGDTRATLYGYLPVKGQAPGEWSGEALGASTTFPNAKAPASLSTSKLPVETGADGDEYVAQLEADFPNTDTSADGYAGMYQLRLRTSGPDEGLTITYDSADIEITGDTWSVVYSQLPQATTTTALSVSPTSAAYHGATVKLVANVTPSSAAGSVQFRDGSKVLKTASVTVGRASYSTDSLADGVHELSARFVPADTASYAASTSSVHEITISARPTTTSLTASKATITEGHKLTLTAKETPAIAGSMAFYDGKKKLATVKVSKGKASCASTNLAVGIHSFKAIFSPSDTADYKPSTSKVVAVTVKK